MSEEWMYVDEDNNQQVYHYNIYILLELNCSNGVKVKECTRRYKGNIYQT